jgi:hypothetical protein
MNTDDITTISQAEKTISTEKCTAIIYSIDEISYYQVEIRHHDESHLLFDLDNKPKSFKSLSEAKKAASAHGAEIAYLALSTTYHELDLSNDFPNDKFNHRYDYVLVDLTAI